MKPGSMMPIVLSSKALPLLQVVEWCLVVALLCWGERGSRKRKAFKRSAFFVKRSALLSD